jgi:Ca-activated chloride channel homolog
VYVAACLGTVWNLQTPQQQRPVFRAGVEAVSIYATVRGADGHLVLDLTKDDFEVRDKGVLQDVTIFSREIVPITVVVLVDVSGSQTMNVVWSRKAARDLIGALDQTDRARVGTFGADILMSSKLTSDKAYLNSALDQLDQEVRPGGGTPLWRAIDLAMNSLKGESGRRVILAVTDGWDDKTRSKAGILGRSSGDPLQLGGGSTTALPMPTPDSRAPVGPDQDSLTDRAVREDFMIYAVGRDPSLPSKPGRAPASPLSSVMEWMAEETGGGYRRVSASEDSAVVMSQVAEELHHQYLIGFTPTVRDGKVHKLEVKIKRGGMSVRARKSYVAK